MGSEDKKIKSQNADDRAKMFTPESTEDSIRGRSYRDHKILEEINANLADQKQEAANESIEVPEDVQEEQYEKQDAMKNKKKRFPLWARILTGILGTLLCTAIVLFGTPWGRAKVKKIAIYLATEYAYSKMNYDDGSNAVPQEPVDDAGVNDVEKKDPLNVMWGNSGHRTSGRHEDYTVNILLLGEEAIGSGTARGRTDMMMIATMDLRTKTVKLTSLMRDMLLHIPDYQGKSYLDNIRISVIFYIN